MLFANALGNGNCSPTTKAERFFIEFDASEDADFFSKAVFSDFSFSMELILLFSK